MKIKDFQDTRKTKFSGVQEIQGISKHAKNLRFLCMQDSEDSTKLARQI